MLKIYFTHRWMVMIINIIKKRLFKWFCSLFSFKNLKTLGEASNACIVISGLLFAIKIEIAPIFAPTSIKTVFIGKLLLIKFKIMKKLLITIIIAVFTLQLSAQTEAYSVVEFKAKPHTQKSDFSMNEF